MERRKTFYLSTEGVGKSTQTMLVMIEMDTVKRATLQ